MDECGWEDEVVVYMGSLDLVPCLVMYCERSDCWRWGVVA